MQKLVETRVIFVTKKSCSVRIGDMVRRISILGSLCGIVTSKTTCRIMVTHSHVLNSRLQLGINTLLYYSGSCADVSAAAVVQVG